MNLLQAAAQIRYFIVGGLALQHWGESRLTRDVDITVLVDPGELEPFVNAVPSQFPGRIPDAREFALQYRVLLIQAQNGVPIDLLLGVPWYEEEAYRWAVEVRFP